MLVDQHESPGSACQRVNLITDADHRLGKELLLRLVSVLVKLTRSSEAPLVPDKV